MNKDFKLSWIRRWLCAHIHYAWEYALFLDRNEIRLFWNIITWYEYFKREFRKKRYVSLEFHFIGDIVATLKVYSRFETILEVKFASKEVPIIRDKDFNIYKQYDGCVYKLSYNQNDNRKLWRMTQA